MEGCHRWRRGAGGDAEREEVEGREGAGRQKRWCGDGQRRRGRLEKTMGILLLPLG